MTSPDPPRTPAAPECAGCIQSPCDGRICSCGCHALPPDQQSRPESAYITGLAPPTAARLVHDQTILCPACNVYHLDHTALAHDQMTVLERSPHDCHPDQDHEAWRRERDEARAQLAQATEKIQTLELLLHNNQVLREAVEDHHGVLLRKNVQANAVVEAARSATRAYSAGCGHSWTFERNRLNVALAALDQARAPDPQQQSRL